MLKKIAFAIAAVLLLGTTNIQAQRVASVDINKILQTQSDYIDGQKELDGLAAKWRTQIQDEQEKIKGLYSRYQAEQVLMSEDTRKQKEDEIVAAEKKLREMQRDKFGQEGQLFKRRQSIVQPIQGRIYNTIEDYANEKGFDFIFDRGGSAGIIFANEEYDKTDDIIGKLK